MDVPSGNRLDVLPVIGFIQDLIQKHSAKNVLSNPEYQAHHQKLMDTGVMDPQLQKWATNPYVSKALQESIGSRTSMMAPVEAASLGGRTPAGVRAGIEQGDADFFGGVSPDVMKTLQGQETITNTKQHYNDATVNQFLENFIKNAPMLSPDAQQNNINDYLQAASNSKSPVLSGIANTMLGAAQQRKADKMKQTEGLIQPSKVSPFSSQPSVPQEENPYLPGAPVAKAYQRATQDQTPPERMLDFNNPYSPPATSGREPTPAFPPSWSPTRQLNMQAGAPLTGAEDVQRVVADSTAKLRTLLEQQQKTLQSTTAGITQRNQLAQKISEIAQPVGVLYDHYQKMGLTPPPDLESLMQQLTKLNYRKQSNAQGAAPLPAPVKK